MRCVRVGGRPGMDGGERRAELRQSGDCSQAEEEHGLCAKYLNAAIEDSTQVQGTQRFSHAVSPALGELNDILLRGPCVANTTFGATFRIPKCRSFGSAEVRSAQRLSVRVKGREQKGAGIA